MNKFKRPGIAVIGAGYWGINHVRNFHSLGALAMVCDSSRESLSRIASQYPGIEVKEEFESALVDKSIRGVVIATPAETHYRLAAAALDAGKDVLVEKPLTLATSEAEQLIELARNRGRILMVGHLLEYHPAVLRLRELISSGALGELRYIYSSRLNLGKVRREENILWSFAPHDIAIILRLVGTTPSKVTATGGTYLQPRIADVTMTNLEFRSGVRAHIFVSWLHPYKEQRLVVVGSRRMAVFDDVRKEGKLVVYDQGVEFVNGEAITRRNDGVEEPIEDREPLREECLHFLECIEKRKRPLTDGESGLQVLRVLEAAEQSLAHDGMPVEAELSIGAVID
ncbi:MAG TPA: Gfo/Idh/MocA family oxidoreductase [Blastocatellia bacterium]|nr:Gfo/Idh/MocA family oxidoreductase [Blastocatellia bacterium]